MICKGGKNEILKGIYYIRWKKRIPCQQFPFQSSYNQSSTNKKESTICLLFINNTFQHCMNNTTNSLLYNTNNVNLQFNWG